MTWLRKTHGKTGFLARLIAFALVIGPVLGALGPGVAAAPSGDGVVLCTSHGAVLVRIDPVSGAIDETPVKNAGRAHICCLMSSSCAGVAVPEIAGAWVLTRPVSTASVVGTRLIAGTCACHQRATCFPVRAPPISRIAI